MTKSQTALEMTRHDAQELHKKISANIPQAQHATWVDVKTVQADMAALGAKMQTLAADQADDVKTGIKAAMAKLAAAGHLVEDKAAATKDGVKHANAAQRAAPGAAARA